ncbi:hypothetical protein [Alloactinosynnema sp. L-07]|uniref:hypothetical protein n=1 Tax=Alloactinosynnema sp. L-07 TaxID=1653480 RepID=UPI00156079A5|nr:hypothetical protein [Alloactinosynnema sp. L-07]
MTSVDRTVKTLLVRLVVVLGAVIGAWLLFAGTASAEDKPRPDKSHGLVDEVLAPLVGGASGKASNSVNAAPLEPEPQPVTEPEPQPAANQRPQPEVVSAPPAVNTKPVPAPKPAPPPVWVAPPPAPAPVPVVHVAKAPARPHVQVQVPKPAPTPVNQVVSTPPRQADPPQVPEQPTAPGAPLASSAPASSSVDTNGHARGMTGLPAGHDPLSPLAYAGVAAQDVDDHPGRDAGLPASSPD